MKKITYITLLFVAVLFASCEKSKVEYDGSVIEFKPIAATLNRGTAVATPATTTILVQLVGPQQGADLVIPYTIDAANTTAVAGTNYTISTSGTVTIPANSSSGKIVLTSNYTNNTAAKKLTLVLADGGPVPVSVNFRTCTVSLTTAATL